jgi:DSF synthase
MSNVEVLPPERSYSTIRCHQTHNDRTFWCHMHAHGRIEPGQRACFTPGLVRDICAWQRTLGDRLRQDDGGASYTAPHVVLASDSDVFNLGGDLDLFVRLIRAGDRQGLLEYARACVYGVHAFHNGVGAHAQTIALVQGDALGGGFEAALSCHTIVAEEGVGMGLPEVLFDLFPGMGAFSFLSRRIGPVRAEQMMLDGNVYDSRELLRMGVIDMVVPRGQGVAAVEDLIRTRQRTPRARRAMRQVQDLVAPVTLDELLRVTEIWVDTAMQLEQRSLRTMERLVRAQTRRAGAHPEAISGVM